MVIIELGENKFYWVVQNEIYFYQINILLGWINLTIWRAFLHTGGCQEVKLVQFFWKKDNGRKKIFGKTLNSCDVTFQIYCHNDIFLVKMINNSIWQNQK